MQLVALFVSAWIEIILQRATSQTNVVALFVSAWIEIYLIDAYQSTGTGRTLCECVD